MLLGGKWHVSRVTCTSPRPVPLPYQWNEIRFQTAPPMARSGHSLGRIGYFSISRSIEIAIFWHANPRPAGGACRLDTPSDYAQIYKKRCRSVPLFLAHLFIHLFHKCCKISDPGLPGSGHQVASSDLTSQKKFNARHSYNDLKTFSDWYLQPLYTKYTSRNFDIGDPRSSQYCDLSKSMG